MEDRPGVGGVALEFGTEQAYIPLELFVPRSPVGVILDDERVESLLVVALVAGEVLMGDALVPPGDVAAYQTLDAALGRTFVPQQVRVGGQRGQRPLSVDHQIGVEEEQIVGLGVGVPDVQGPVVAEVHPRLLVELARDAVECGTDPLLCSVARTGIGDHPGVDQVANGGEAALDDVGLVLDDHAQADGRLHGNTNPGRTSPGDPIDGASGSGGGSPVPRPGSVAAYVPVGAECHMVCTVPLLGPGHTGLRGVLRPRRRFRAQRASELPRLLFPVPSAASGSAWVASAFSLLPGPFPFDGWAARRPSQ